MDPYLEGPSWMSFHGQFIAEIARQLAPRLRPRYVALMDEGIVWDSPQYDVQIDDVERRPDVAVMELAEAPGGTAAATATAAPLTMVTVMTRPVTQRRVEIRDVEHRRLVCAIELLSPTNNRGGRRQYLAKRARVPASSAHLIEIDLLRRGRRVPMLEPLPAQPYFVFVSRSDQRPYVQVWPVPLAGRLPVVPVPLQAPDPDVMLDLQLALTQVYDGVGYDLILNYGKPPAVPLRPEEAAWARGVLGTTNGERPPQRPSGPS